MQAPALVIERHAPPLAGFFTRHIAEIRSDRALTLHGAALAAANVMTFATWKFRSGVPLMIGRGADSLCWPFLENCHAFQLPVFFVNYGLWGYLLLSLLTGYCFLTKRVAQGYWLLILIDVIRVLVMFQDYRLRANQHYMLNWVVLAYVFLPGKRALAHHVIVSLYFWAGVLKLDWDWLSGASLYSQENLWFPQWLVPASCVYVLVLEMILVWGLYARRNWVFYGTLGQLVLFHLTSWPIVGFFYPTLMFCILAILPLTRLLHPPHEWVTFPWKERGGRVLLNASVMGVFGLFQLVPHTFPGDTAVTGEGRVFALHMFDALIECEANVTYRLADGSARQDAFEQTKRMPHRRRCDPLIYFAIAKNECAHIAAGSSSGGDTMPAGAIDLDLMLRSKRNTGAEYHTVIDIRNFCASDPRYNVFRHNAWIQLPL
jgi:hypothetical protein